MNDKIRKLAQEAGLQPFEDCGPGYVHKMERFAELVVKECVRLARIADKEDQEYAWFAIQKHFGVED